jgi:hypothetical protein
MRSVPQQEHRPNYGSRVIFCAFDQMTEELLVKDRVVINGEHEIRRSLERRFDATVRSGCVMQRSVALHELNLWKLFLDRLACAIGRSIVNNDDVDF